jgi:multicomponent Na+:H+ antiporter subunit C
MWNNLPYILCFLLFVISLYGILANPNYYKKLISLALLQSSVIIFYILFAYSFNAKSPFSSTGVVVNPLPHVLMLTAIVVGLAVLSVGLALLIRLKEEFNTADEDQINSHLDKKNND